jgi:hypothetical protein
MTKRNPLVGPRSALDRAGGLRLSAFAVGLGVWALTSPALAADGDPTPAATPAPAAPAPVPGQKEPCVPATNYALGYDCELFPLPALPPGHTAPVVAAPATIQAAGAATSASSSSSSPSHAPAYAAFAVGAGGVGMTVAFGILALKNKSTLSQACPTSDHCPSSASSTVSALKTDGILADVGLGVAVLGVTVGAILFATEHGSRTSTGVRHVEPWLGLGGGGFKGTF